MHFFHGRMSRTAVLFCCLLPGSMPCHATETMKATLEDGRQVTGYVDARTDSDRLWIARTESGVYLASGFRWAEIVAGEVENQSLNAQQLRSWSADKALHHVPELPKAIKQVENRSEISPRPKATVSTSSVKTLVIRAFVSQWDQDAQSDGVRIFVSPLDAEGLLVPVAGQIEFTLVVEQENDAGRPISKSHPTFVPLARSSHRVRPSDFANGPAVYHLAFLKQHPDFDPGIATQALLHARLAIPGRGVFEASDAQVSLRECSRIRDQMQLYSRSRYLPFESGGRPNP